MVSPDLDPHAAPGRLEDVRTLLNTWRVPNDTRTPADDMSARRTVLRELRDDLRDVVEGRADADGTLTGWVHRCQVAVVVDGGQVAYHHRSGAAGEVVATVLHALTDGTWGRLKACPDCRWVFYDHTRNGSKRWCLMAAAGPGSRGCGNIAKVRRHRARARPARR